MKASTSLKGKATTVGNIGTQALQNSTWSQSSSSLRGVFKDLAKVVSVGIVAMTGGLAQGEIKVGEADATRTDTLTQQTAALAANDLHISAQNDLTLIGAKVDITNLASLQANNITIDAAHEQTIVSESHTDQTVSSAGASFSSEKGELTLGSMTDTDQTERTTTTANTWNGSGISAGNLSLSANNNLAILASDINVQNNASITSENILVGGREATTETTQDSITKTKTLNVGVKNAYVDIFLTIRALDKAKDAVKDAESAYDTAKQKVAEGKLPKSDLDFYKVNLAAATANLASATTAVAGAGAAAAANTGTYGFYATAGATTQVTTNSRSATQGTWNGSSIKVGNHASLNAQNNLTVEGSAIAAQGILKANAKNINITAGKNTYTENTESHSEGQSASVAASLGGSVSGSVGVNTSKSNGDSQSTEYTNSRLKAGSLVSNSNNLTIEGGHLYGDEVAITTDTLTVASVQNTAKSDSQSTGRGINLGSGSGTSIAVNDHQTNIQSDYASINQQSRIAAGDKGYQINVTGNTHLVGGLVTSTDAAEAAGNNAFSTGTLTQEDLANHAVYDGTSVGVSVGVNSGDGSGLGFSSATGKGATGDSRHSITQSGINTANIVITDADKQQALTGNSVSQTLADIQTSTSTDTADTNSGALKNNFNQAEVEQQINNQREVTQAFKQNVQQISGEIINGLNQQKDELNAQLENGEINQTEYDQQTATLDNYSLLANTLSAGLSAPTDSLTGQLAAAASPAVANQIGQYFKGLAADNADNDNADNDNENGQLNTGQKTAHVLAHGILAAAVASAGGNDATTAGIAAAGSEAAAPVLAKWLYDKDNSEGLNAEQKQTLSSIIGAASTTVGATTGKVNNAIAAGQAGQNAVENNYLSYQEKSKQLELKDNQQECVASGNCSEEEQGNLQQQIEGYDQLDKKRDQIVADLCKQGSREDCNTAVNIASSVMSGYPDYLKKGFHRSTEQEINDAGGEDNYDQLKNEFQYSDSQLKQAMANGLDQTGQMTEGFLDGPKEAAFITLGLGGVKLASKVINVGEKVVSPTTLSVVNGAVSGGVGGYTSSGDSAQDKIVGTAIGVSTGTLVGYIPGASNVTKTLLVGSSANYLGQKSNLVTKELIDNGFDDFNSDNTEVNWLQVGTSGVGAVGGNLIGKTIAGQTAGPVIGSQVKAPISPTVGGTVVGAIVEGTIIGQTEKHTPTIEEVENKLEEMRDEK